jgi:hypothetical protein
MIESMSGRRLSEVEAFQQRIGPYLDRLLQAFEESGAHTGAKIDHDRRELILYGVGEPPASLEAMMAEAPADLEVQWRSAPHTRDELVVETQRIMSAFDKLNTGGPRTDGTALEFTTTDAELLAAGDPQGALGSRYPVTIHHGGRPSLYERSDAAQPPFRS